MIRLFNLLTGDGLILAIFVLGVLALPYSPELRKLPFIASLAKNSEAARYVLLKKIYNNSFQLIVHILRHSIKLLIRWVAVGVFVLLAYHAANVFSPETFSTPKVVVLVAGLALACPLLGMIQWIFWTRKLLYDVREYEIAARKVGAPEARESRA